MSTSDTIVDENRLPIAVFIRITYHRNMFDHKEKPLWTPTDPTSTQTHLFLSHINKVHSLSLTTYAELWEWSCAHRSDFWSALWDWEQVIGDKKVKENGKVVDEDKTPEENPLWFTGSSLNWAENQLRHVKSRPDDIAIIQVSEPCVSYIPPIKHITQVELYFLVGKAQRSLRAAGVGKGDRVAFWGGNCLEAVVTVLATSSIGGIFSSAAADFGIDGVVERLEQIQPKVLVVTNGVIYAGTPRPLLPRVAPLLDILKNPPSVVVSVDHLPEELVPTFAEVKEKLVRWDDWLDQEDGEVNFVRMGFNEPIWILFSSGTTGKPKAIVVRTHPPPSTHKLNEKTDLASSRWNAPRFPP